MPCRMNNAEVGESGIFIFLDPWRKGIEKLERC